MRLAVNVGTIDEQDDQLGFAPSSSTGRSTARGTSPTRKP